MLLPVSGPAHLANPSSWKVSTFPSLFQSTQNSFELRLRNWFLPFLIPHWAEIASYSHLITIIQVVDPRGSLLDWLVGCLLVALVGQLLVYSVGRMDGRLDDWQLVVWSLSWLVLFLLTSVFLFLVIHIHFPLSSSFLFLLPHISEFWWQEISLMSFRY